MKMTVKIDQHESLRRGINAPDSTQTVEFSPESLSIPARLFLGDKLDEKLRLNEPSFAVTDPKEILAEIDRIALRQPFFHDLRYPIGPTFMEQLEKADSVGALAAAFPYGSHRFLTRGGWADAIAKFFSQARFPLNNDFGHDARATLAEILNTKGLRHQYLPLVRLLGLPVFAYADSQKAIKAALHDLEASFRMDKDGMATDRAMTFFPFAKILPDGSFAKYGTPEAKGAVPFDDIYPWWKENELMAAAFTNPSAAMLREKAGRAEAARHAATAIFALPISCEGDFTPFPILWEKNGNHDVRYLELVGAAECASFKNSALGRLRLKYLESENGNALNLQYLESRVSFHATVALVDERIREAELLRLGLSYADIDAGRMSPNDGRMEKEEIANFEAFRAKLPKGAKVRIVRVRAQKTPESNWQREKDAECQGFTHAEPLPKYKGYLAEATWLHEMSLPITANEILTHEKF